MLFPKHLHKYSDPKQSLRFPDICTLLLSPDAGSPLPHTVPLPVVYELHEEKLTASSLHCIFFWNNEIVPLPKTPSPDSL